MEQRAMPLIIFDGDCAFCSRILNWALGHIEAEATPFQSLGPDGLATFGLSERQAQESVWVLPGPLARPARLNTPKMSGAAACAELLRRSARPQWRLTGQMMGAPGVLTIAEWGYRIVAANRHRLPGGTESCCI